MDNSFRIISRSSESADYFSVFGNIDAFAEKQLQGLPATVGKQVVQFDFNEAGRINSMGIALLLRCFKKIREEKKAEIILRDLSTTNAMLFKMTGIFLLANHEK